MPATVGRITVGNPRTADPCSLIDQQALRPHGIAILEREGSKFSACRAVFSSGTNVLYDFLAPGEAGRVVGPESERVGEITIGRFGASNGRCERRILLSDGNVVLISADGSADRDADPCAIAETGMIAAVNLLDRRGLATRDAPDVESSLEDVDPCDLLGPTELAVVPGLQRAPGVPGFAGWSCTWATAGTESQVHLAYHRYSSAYDIDYDRTDDGATAVDFGGRPGAYLSAPEGTSCLAKIGLRAYTSDGSCRLDGVHITVHDSEPGAELCRHAIALAEAAAAEFPPPA
jgi:eukaryotic-like serine/threonine-protein kinase